MGEVLKLQEISLTRMKTLNPEKTVVAATMSPMEVHGPHLPIGQDWLEAQALVENLSEKIVENNPGWSVLLLPPVPVAEDSLPHLGSISMPPHVVSDVAYYLLKPFALAGFKRLIISSFHGGPRHMTALECAADKLTRKHDTQAISIFSAVVAKMEEGNVFYDAVKDLPDNKITIEEIARDWHGGFVETSIALHLWPQLVVQGWDALPPLYREKKEDEHGSYYMGPGKEGLGGKITEILELFSNVKGSIEHYSANTYSGYPAMASKEFGKAIFDHLVKVAGEIVQDFIIRGTEVEHHTPLWKMRGLIMDKNFNMLLNEVIGVYRMKKADSE